MEHEGLVRNCSSFFQYKHTLRICLKLRRPVSIKTNPFNLDNMKPVQSLYFTRHEVFCEKCKICIFVVLGALIYSSIKCKFGMFKFIQP